MEYLIQVAKMVCAQWQDLAIVGAVMVSAVIVLIGILKPIVFNRIPWKPIRRAALASTNIFLSFVATAIYFAWFGRDWHLYCMASVITAIACVVTYFVYESYGLRDGIHKIGNLAIDKAAKIAKLWFNKVSPQVIDAEIKKAAQELKATAKSELKSVSNKSYKKDKDLKNV